MSRHSIRVFASVVGVAGLGGILSATWTAPVATAGRPMDAAPRRAGSHEEARIELGRRLFFDPVASRVGMRSCADCHDPKHGYSDPSPVSNDDRLATRRHSQTLLDGADNPSSHWDGAFRRVEDLVTARVTLAARGRYSNGHELPGASARGSEGSVDSSAGGGPVGKGSAPAADSPTDGAAMYDGAMDGGMDGGMDAGMYESGMGDGEGRGDDCPMPPSGSGSSPGTQFRGPTGMDEAPPAPDAPTTPTDPAPSSSGASGGTVSGAGGASAASGAGNAGGRGADPAGGAAAKAAAAPPSAPDPYDPSSLGGTDDRKSEFIAESVDIAKLPTADHVIEDGGRYREAFEAAYGSPGVTIAKIAEAIGAYCHSVRTGTSSYDRFTAGDPDALSLNAKRGLEIFQGRGHCASCHTMTGDRAAFTDYGMHVTGISWKGLDAKDEAERAKFAPSSADEGSGGVTGKPKDKRAFKTPTLRDVASRGPYMHDGSLASLEAVVRHYAKPPSDVNLDPHLEGFDASPRDVSDLVSFLRALSSDARPGLATAVWGKRAKTTRLEFVDAKGRPLANQPFLAVPAGDLLPGGHIGDAPLALVTDDKGVVEFAPPAWTHVQVTLPDGIRPRRGTLVPDTCREARIEVPVLGRTRLLITFPAAIPAPLALASDHEAATFFYDRRLPRTVFRREAVMEAGGGKQIAVYSAAFRTDAPPTVALRLPAKVWGLTRLRMTLESETTKPVDLSK